MTRVIYGVMEPALPPSAERVVDANLNRAAEALRVAEDVCRFHWNLEGLARELKDLRHEILRSTTGGRYRRENLIRWRDIEGDVGRDLPSPPAPSGRDLGAVAFRNLQRAKEAIRTLEEVSRAGDPAMASALEKCRYHLYSIEKGIGHLAAESGPRRRLAEARLYLLATSELASGPLADVVRAAIDAGVDAVQLREKGRSDREILRVARALREITARGNALFIVNDRADIACAAHADGVHLGQDDLPVAQVRALLGEGRIVGVSTHSVEQALQAGREGADYIGVGPVFSSTTKDAGPPLGPTGLQSILERASVPSFAIGGITAENLPQVVGAGARGIAVSSAIMQARDPGGVARALREGMAAGP